MAKAKSIQPSIPDSSVICPVCLAKPLSVSVGSPHENRYGITQRTYMCWCMETGCDCGYEVVQWYDAKRETWNLWKYRSPLPGEELTRRHALPNEWVEVSPPTPPVLLIGQGDTAQAITSDDIATLTLPRVAAVLESAMDHIKSLLEMKNSYGNRKQL